MVALLGTTVLYQPPRGAARGLQHDVSPSLGYGRYITGTIALELDLGPTFVRSHYQSVALVPAVVWGFASRFYAAGRALVLLDPKADLALAPGVGAFHAFDSGLAISLELNAITTVGRGHPYLGVSITAGVLLGF